MSHSETVSDRPLSPMRLSPVNRETPAVTLLIYCCPSQSPLYICRFNRRNSPEIQLSYRRLPSASRLPTSARGLEKSASPPSPIAVPSPQGLVDDGNWPVLCTSFPSFKHGYCTAPGHQVERLGATFMVTRSCWCLYLRYGISFFDLNCQVVRGDWQEVRR
jgi:hypothetical protein